MGDDGVGSQLAAAAGLTTRELGLIESGEYQPPVSEVQRLHDVGGEALAVRVEVYDSHDDVLECQYRRDPLVSRKR